MKLQIPTSSAPNNPGLTSKLLCEKELQTRYCNMLSPKILAAQSLTRTFPTGRNKNISQLHKLHQLGRDEPFTSPKDRHIRPFRFHGLFNSLAIACEISQSPLACFKAISLVIQSHLTSAPHLTADTQLSSFQDSNWHLWLTSRIAVLARDQNRV